MFWAFLLMVLMQPLSSIPKASNAFLQLTIVIWLLVQKRKKGKREKREGEAKAAIRQSLQKQKDTKRKQKKGRKRKKKEEKEKNFDLYTIFWKKDTHTQSGSLVLVIVVRCREDGRVVGHAVGLGEQLLAQRIVTCLGSLGGGQLALLFAESCMENKDKRNHRRKEDGCQCNQ